MDSTQAAGRVAPVPLTVVPFRIVSDCWYPETFLRLRGIDGDALSKARREGKLRYKKVGSGVLIKGAWLREWLEEGGGLCQK